MLQPRVVKLTLFASVAFGAVATVLNVSLAAETQQGLATIIPILTGYDRETRYSMELACISQKGNGPVAYGACLDRQIASLQGSPGIPNLNGYDRETRYSMELACISEKGNGPVAYGACLDRQTASLKGSPGIPNLSGYDRETRYSMELACISEKGNGPVAYGACLDRQIASLQRSAGIPNLSGQHDSDAQQSALPPSIGGEAISDTSRREGTAVHAVNATSTFTTENIMKIHQGMASKKILEMFGAPKNVSQSVCGASVGKPWACTTWEYGEFPYDWAVFTFSGGSGSLVLNTFEVHRK